MARDSVAVEVVSTLDPGVARCRLVYADFMEADGRAVAAPERRSFDLHGFTPTAGSVYPGFDDKGQPVIWVGLGDRRPLTGGLMARSVATVFRATRLPTIAIDTRSLGPNMDSPGTGCELTIGALQGAYVFRSDTGSGSRPDPRRLVLCGDDVEGLRAGARRGSALGAAQALARDLVNEPANYMTPTKFAEVADDVARRTGMEISIWGPREIASAGLGGLEAVSAGSRQAPRFVTLKYPNPDSSGATNTRQTVALVGKGVTFDSGGLCLKAADPMATMKIDMCGAAAVLGAMQAIADLGSDVCVAAYIPLAENMPGGGATRPGDLARLANGLTVEVVNTDAEGRLLLADGLSLAVKEGAAALIDIASLTGACRVSLGTAVGGVFGTDDRWVASIVRSGTRASEPLWRLPLVADYAQELHSLVADLRNVGRPVRPNEAGAIVAALFLERFVGTVPWAHIDMGGPAYRPSATYFSEEGATGFGVRTLAEAVQPANAFFGSADDA